MKQSILSLSALILFAITFASCAIFQLPKDQQAYMDKVRAESTTFRVARDTSDNVWSRAQVFVVQYANKKLGTITDFIIDTDRGGRDRDHAIDSSYNYKITRFNTGNQTEFTVSCSTLHAYANTDDNAHIATHFIRTGEMPFPLLLQR